MAFTSGPWTVGQDGYNVNGVYSRTGCVATVFGIPVNTAADEISALGDQWAEGLANARLIAAAPKLLAALERISSLEGEINPSNCDHDDACNLNRSFCEAIMTARAALSELRGDA